MARPRKEAKETALKNTSASVFPASFMTAVDASAPRASQVYTIMRRAIIEMILPPGSIINERAICEELGVSRTPLREALIKLNDEALVKIVPNSGTFVSRIVLETVFEGQLVRHALEMKLVRLAAIRMTADAERQFDFNMYQQRRLAQDCDYEQFYELDEAFHALIAEVGSSPRVWRIVHSAKAQLDRVRRLAFPMPSHLDIILSEHDAILTGLKLHDPDRAGVAMEGHLDRVFESIRTLVSEQKDLFSAEAESTLDNYLSWLREK
ncbi:hypothetical protein BV911_05445 [Pseudoruegeria sp. SK021]|nr:hypothetical protein BV911_05445 [Pseudoruegeria sp. SK021]